VSGAARPITEKPGYRSPVAASFLFADLHLCGVPMPDVNNTGDPAGDPDENPREALYKEAIKLLGAKDKDAETKEGIKAEISSVAQLYTESKAASDTAPGFSEARSLFEDAEEAADNFLKALNPDYSRRGVKGMVSVD